MHIGLQSTIILGWNCFGFIVDIYDVWLNPLPFMDKTYPSQTEGYLGTQEVLAVSSTAKSID